jgi:hypothetical protein
MIRAQRASVQVIDVADEDKDGVRHPRTAADSAREASPAKL